MLQIPYESVDSGPWIPNPQTILVGGLTGLHRMGVNYADTAFLGARILEWGAAQERFSDARFDTIREEMNARYGFSF